MGVDIIMSQIEELQIGKVKLDEKQEALKLTKNSKGYTWEIKTNFEKIDKEAIRRLIEINNDMIESFGTNSD